ncbi:hypothetical protein Poli38472_009222 [Pythium oligandrum]|uniref:MINDY deubiquitinase domain-containing protein n=1 Tax=Pythium oligandrum TaxID=41045 RepID=A0A8K1FIJ4_PYTOL|nr:hypothetical protein Poli38472_009222 [Pythium oligandrum]|eukprot:TMW65055.1 hypothetical protein Poli38472_009222 [Pythium oligandrum]
MEASAMPMDEVYAVKRVDFLGKPVTYICQNINGPCPLLAISNVLLLRGHITIDDKLQDGGVISAQELIQVVTKRLVEANPPLPESDELGRLTQQKTLQDVQRLMPSLLVGLDVNVRFHSITDFEYTVACAVFDMLDIALVHGWLLDIQDTKTVDVVQNKSYNELIERVVDYRAVMMTETPQEGEPVESNAVSAEHSEEKPSEAPPPAINIQALRIDVEKIEETSSVVGSPSPKKSPSKKTVETLKKERQLTESDATDTAAMLLEEGPVLEEFFASSASQLTYYGLVKLHEDLRERQLSVFFRNNHFSTLFKYDGSLYLLVTDAGYLDEPTVVWERLNEIDGDTEYLDATFRPLNASETRQQTILQQQEEARRRQLEPPSESHSEYTDEDRTTSQGEMHSSETDPDFLLALRLQEEEEAQARALAASRAQAAPPAPTTAVQQNTAPVPSGYDSRTQSQGASGSESEAYAVNANGELMLSEAELQAQREAALYYQQQKHQMEAQRQAGYQHQYQAPQSYPANQTAARPSPATGSRRPTNDCSLM